MSLAAARALYYSPGTRAHNISRYETDLVNYLSHWIARCSAAMNAECKIVRLPVAICI